MSVNCVYCGHVNPDGSTVCLSCGRTLPPAPSAGGGFGQPQQPQSWGQTPGAPPPPPSYPPAGQPPSSYPPPADPYGGASYPPQQQPPSYGSQPPMAQQPPSYGNQPSFGGSSYPPQAPSYGQAPPYGGGQNDAAKSAKMLAMIGMIVGIAGIVLGWCCYSGFLFGPAAIVLGFVAKSKLNTANSTDGNGMALAAIATGIVAFVEPIVLLVIALLLGGLGSIVGQ